MYFLLPSASQVLLLTGIGVVLYILWMLLARCFDGKENYRLPPGKWGLPFVGDTVTFLIRKGALLKERRELYGEIYKLSLFGRRTVRVTGIGNIRTILSGENVIVESSWPESLKSLLGRNGLLMSSGAAHRHLKKSFTQLLSKEFLEQHTTQLYTVIKNVLAKWSCPLDVFHECSKLATELFIRFTINSQMTEKEVDELKEAAEIFRENIFSLKIYFPFFPYYKACRAKETLKKLLTRQVKHYTDIDFQFLKVLNKMLHKRNREVNLEEDENAVFDIIIELLFAGGDTITSAIFSLIYLVGRDENVQRKLCEEVTERDLVDKNLDLSIEDLNDLPYVNCVVKEALRLLPPVGGCYRKVIKTFNLKDYVIPKGWSIIAGIRETHEYDENILNPLTFNPERWDDLDDSTFIAFGHGPRKCPGRYYAQLIMKIFLVEYTRNGNFTFAGPDFGLDYFPSPRPKKKHVM